MNITKKLTPKNIITAVIIALLAVFLIFLFISFLKSRYYQEVLPEDIGNTQDIFYSNIMNKSSVISENDSTYFVGGGEKSTYYIAREDSSGVRNILYQSETKIKDLNQYQNKLYFICAMHGRNTLCSLDQNDHLEELTKDKDIDDLFIYGKNAYYILNHYGSGKKSGAVFRINLETNRSENITVIEDSNINYILEYQEKIYILYSKNDDNDKGHILRINTNTPSIRNEYNPFGSLLTDISFMTVSEGRLYIVTAEKTTSGYAYSLHVSLNEDYAEFQKISSHCGKTISVYGNYIYYSAYPDAYHITADSKINLYRMRINGQDTTVLSETALLNQGIAKSKIYYTDPQSYNSMSILINGSVKESTQ